MEKDFDSLRADALEVLVEQIQNIVPMSDEKAARIVDTVVESTYLEVMADEDRIRRLQEED